MVMEIKGIRYQRDLKWMDVHQLDLTTAYLKKMIYNHWSIKMKKLRLGDQQLECLFRLALINQFLNQVKGQSNKWLLQLFQFFTMTLGVKIYSRRYPNTETVQLATQVKQERFGHCNWKRKKNIFLILIWILKTPLPL